MNPDADLRSTYGRRAPVYHPPRWFAEQANVSDPGIRDRFDADWPDCWSAAAELLDWSERSGDVLVSDDRGYRWFEGGSLNACYNCVDRHVETGGKNRVAIRWLGRLGEVRTYTYQDLYREVNEVAAALRTLGVAEDDVVTLYLPTIPELPITMLACARIGALHAVVSAGFSANALAERMSQSGSRYLVTCDGFYRRGEAVEQKRKADNARLIVPHDVDELVVIDRLGYEDRTPLGPTDHAYEELVASHAGETVEPVGRAITVEHAGMSTEEVYEEFPRLDERRSQRAGTLSGGEQQMLAIARALKQSTDLMMLDEPYEGLAPQIIANVEEAIERIRENGITVLLVEQNAVAAMKIADRCYVIDQGQIVFEGEADELRDDEETRQRYLGV